VPGRASERLEELGRRFARLATRVVVARPGLWRLFRGPLRAQFDHLAPAWEGRRGPEALAALAAALDRLEQAPATALDLGTGTGKAARLVAERFPDCEVVGVDLAPKMIEQARGVLREELAGRVRFDVADAAELPFPDGAFDLVILLNMIPFFDELARVAAPSATIVVASMFGPETPIYTPFPVLRERFEARGFERFEELRVGEGDAFLARRGERG
jgi:SAM-dependent methyltransferase